MEKESHPVINACLGTVIGTLIAAGIIAFIPLVRNFVFSLFVYIYQYLISKSQLPNYVISLLSLSVLSIFLIISLVIKTINKIRNKDTTSVNAYTEDMILDLKWRWSRIENKFPSDDLWCFCPECDGRLVHEHVYDHYVGTQKGTVFHCNHCGFASKELPGNYEDIKKRISIEVERKINTGEVV